MHLPKKRTLVSAAFLAAAIGALFAVWRLRTVPLRTYSDADFGIRTYVSAADRDGDGVDDQQDILESVRAYLATKPAYRSRYYSGGWPSDGCGVCTDVVAWGLLGAGYDLRELVDADIRSDKAAYGAQIVDKDIDYRRVRNLNIYLSRNARALTTDLSQIGEWQGGDIVVFEGHIGVVSDRRNRHGVPLLLHHGSSLQLSYEEDVLERRDDLVAHYRVG